jgi:Domain of unknown function (DUF4440)
MNRKEETTMRTLILVGLLLCLFIPCSTLRSEPPPQSEAETIRATERERLKSLVEANMDVARKLHADDFQLVNPFGETYSKEQYLSGIASGRLDYLVWEPVSSIEVRLYGEGAVIRYQSKLQIIVDGEKTPLMRYWHTDSYEKRKGQWQIVWSQATAIEEKQT